MDVETLATAAVSRAVALCSHLRPVIATNDKTLFTDGHIDVHSSLKRSKADWQGKVPVQVKGRSRPSNKALASFKVPRSDLLAFQRDSGVLYFVVAINPKTAIETPYYAILSPFKIDALLRDEPKDRAAISVRLKRLPDSPADLERIVRLALETRAQNIAMGFDSSLFDRAVALTLHTATDIDPDKPIVLDYATSDFALALKTAEGMVVPLDGTLHLLPQAQEPRPIEVQIGSGGVVYDSASVVQLDERRADVSLSPGLILTFSHDDDERATNVTLSLEDSLVGRIKSLEFFIGLLDSRTFTVDGQQTSIELVGEPDVVWLRGHLDALREAEEVLSLLAVDTELVSLAEVKDHQLRQLGILHSALVGAEEISQSIAEPNIAIQRVGQWRIMTVMSPGEEPGKVRLSDPFLPATRQQFRWSATDRGAEKATPVTAYDIVDDDLLGTVLNLRLGSIVGAYQAIADFESTFSLANQRVIALIASADAFEAREEEFLAAAKCLNTWLIDEDGARPRHLINGWQISWRQGGLSTEERSQVRVLKREVILQKDEDVDQLELACALLLGDREEVGDLIGRMADDRIQTMRGWPIWKLCDD